LPDLRAELLDLGFADRLASRLASVKHARLWNLLYGLQKLRK
jgi:hypothetical protein